MESLIFDTDFLIDLQREMRHGDGCARKFLSTHRDSQIFLPVVVLGEFAEGFEKITDYRFQSIVQQFEIVPITEEVASVYARITREMRGKGKIIGANDLWIASIAISHHFPLVTNNLRHFELVPELNLRPYNS